jgi:hypothetical protein
VVRDTRYAHLREEPPPLHFDLYCQAKEFGGATYIVRTKMKASENCTFAAMPRKPLLDVARRGKIPGHPVGDGVRKTWNSVFPNSIAGCSQRYTQPSG